MRTGKQAVDPQVLHALGDQVPACADLQGHRAPQLPHAPRGAFGLPATRFDLPPGGPGGSDVIYQALRRRLPRSDGELMFDESTQAHSRSSSFAMERTLAPDRHGAQGQLVLVSMEDAGSTRKPFSSAIVVLSVVATPSGAHPTWRSTGQNLESDDETEHGYYSSTTGDGRTGSA